MKIFKLIVLLLNKIIMALENKKLSAYDDLASANIDTTTKLVALTGATKVNNNLPVTNFIEDSLTSTSVVKPLSAKQGKTLQDTKAPIANPTFTGSVNGITKAMVGLGNVTNESKSTMFTNPAFTGIATLDSYNVLSEFSGPKMNRVVINYLEPAGGMGSVFNFWYNPGSHILKKWNGTSFVMAEETDYKSSFFLELTSNNICRYNPTYEYGTKLIPVGDYSLLVDSNSVKFNGVQEFADNAAAITGGLTTGYVYRTGDVLKIVHN